MTSLTLVTLLHVSFFAADTDAYAIAYRETAETGKPMVVVVGTDWCGPCQTLKRKTIPQLRKRGLLKKVAFAIVNLDRNRALGRKLTGGGPIPQLVMFRKTANGWRRRKLVGGQSVATVEKFINDGIALDEAAKKSDSATKEEIPPEKAPPETKVQPVSKQVSHDN